MYYSYSTIKFDTPLLGVDIKEGYRIRFEQRMLSGDNQLKEDNLFQDLHNYLCRNYGESNLFDKGKSGAIYSGTNQGNTWYLSNFRNNFTLVVPTEQMFLTITQHFNMRTKFKDTTLSTIVEEVIEQHLFKKITDKQLRKIQSSIAAKLTSVGYNFQWYDIKISGNPFLSLSFSIEDKEYLFNLSA